MCFPIPTFQTSCESVSPLVHFVSTLRSPIKRNGQNFALTERHDDKTTGNFLKWALAKIRERARIPWMCCKHVYGVPINGVNRLQTCRPFTHEFCCFVFCPFCFTYISRFLFAKKEKVGSQGHIFSAGDVILSFNCNKHVLLLQENDNMWTSALFSFSMFYIYILPRLGIYVQYTCTACRDM